MTGIASKGRSPSKLRMAGFILLAIYPLVTLLLEVVLAITPGWNLWVRTALVAPVMVTAMVWGIMPFIQRRLSHLL